MRCKACDKPITNPITIVDKHDDSEHEEWLCKRCNSFAFVSGGVLNRQGDRDDLVDELYREGYLRIDGGTLDEEV